MLREFGFTILVYLVIKLVLLALGIGVGWLLHWLIPAIDLGIGVLIGVVSTGLSVYFFIRLMTARDVIDDESDIDVLPRVTYLIDPLPTPRRTRKRKSSA